MASSLKRALTTRVRKEAEPSSAPSSWLGRAASQRSPNAKPIKRGEISLPVALLSTTNMLSYEAPNIVNAPHVERMGGRYFSASSSVGSSSNSVSEEDSDHTGSVHSEETDATSLSLSSPEIGRCDDGFFKSSTSSRMTTSSTASVESEEPSYALASPQIPARALSHSKKAHMLSHKRSIQRMNSVRDSSDVSNVSPRRQTSVHRTTTPSHPFGRELEQLNEVAEEFGASVRTTDMEADFTAIGSKGLARFCANDYLDEISSIYSSTYEEEHQNHQAMIWI